MNLGRKLSIMILAVSMLLGTSITVFATPNDDVIAALKAAKVPTTYITQAENYLKTRTLTASEASAVTTQITTAKNVMNTAGVTDVTKLSDAQRQQVISAVTSAGSAVGLDIDVSKESTGQYSIVAKDENGTIVANFTTSAVKQTGINDVTLIVGAFLLVLSVSSVFVLKRVID